MRYSSHQTPEAALAFAAEQLATELGAQGFVVLADDRDDGHPVALLEVPRQGAASIHSVQFALAGEAEAYEAVVQGPAVELSDNAVPGALAGIDFGAVLVDGRIDAVDPARDLTFRAVRRS